MGNAGLHCSQTVYVIPDEDLKLSLATLETDANFTEHLAAHIIATRHHLTGAPEPPEPSYAPYFHQPATTGPSPKKPSSPAACCVHTPASARNSPLPTSPSSAMEPAAAVLRSRAACIPRRSSR